ncbi:hypothetical protein NC980_26060 [Leptolyngbya sp. AS-A5]
MTHLWKFRIGKASALKDAAVDLSIKFTGAVVLGSGKLKIKEALILGFTPRDKQGVMSPA